MSDQSSEVRDAYEKFSTFGDSRWKTWQKAWHSALWAQGPKVVEELKAICSQAYQLLSRLSLDAGRFGDPQVMQVLENLSRLSMVHPMTSVAGTASAEPVLAPQPATTRFVPHPAAAADSPAASPARTETGGQESVDKDAERLDWLETFHKLPKGPSSAYGEVGLHLMTRTDTGWKLDPKLGGTEHPTLREAVDAAITAYQWIPQ